MSRGGIPTASTSIAPGPAEYASSRKITAQFTNLTASVPFNGTCPDHAAGSITRPALSRLRES